jgi:hypothetical protein
MSILPILGDDTLIYGTSNGGETVHNSDPVFNEEVLKLARFLNLKTHYIQLQEIHTAVDCEGHKGLDGRYYMVISLERLYYFTFDSWILHEFSLQKHLLTTALRILICIAFFVLVNFFQLCILLNIAIFSL